MQNNDVIIGIDLGTTNSVAAVVRHGQPVVIPTSLGDDRGIVPSCVGVVPDGTLAVGKTPYNQYVVAPERTIVSIKRKMGTDTSVMLGDQAYTPAEISAFILKALKEQAEAYLQQQVSKAIITVPAYFTDVQRQATRDAGRIAGLEVIRIINEPTAAALTYNGSAMGAQTLLIYDLGGGTFDVSIVRSENGVVEVLATAGDNHLGGDDFDQRIVDHLLQHMTSELGLTVGDDPVLRARLKRAAEAAKITLSSEPYARIEEDYIGAVKGEAKHLSVELSRQVFEDLIDDLLHKTMEAVTRALNDADLRPSQLDKIVLVGGSTRIPKVSELLRQRLGHQPHGEVDPDLCVALGAAIEAGRAMGIEVQNVLVDITPYTFGTSALGELYGMPYAHVFVPIIHRNAKLPVHKSEVFYKLYEDQDKVDVRVYQGEDPDARRNVEIGNFRFTDLGKSAAAQEGGIVVTYSLDLDGILNVRAVERASGKEMRCQIDNILKAAVDTQIAASQDKLEKVWTPSFIEEAAWGEPPPQWEGVEPRPDAKGGDMPAEMQQLIERARRAIVEASEDDRDEVIGILEDINTASLTHAHEKLAALRANLEEILFYLE